MHQRLSYGQMKCFAQQSLIRFTSLPLFRDTRLNRAIEAHRVRIL
jgi:hypothetical protein